MRIVGVVDVRGGRAVHARRGERATYAPVGTAAGLEIDGDPVALARLYVERFGVHAVYVADLDAIEVGPARMNPGIIREVAALGVPVWVDAGVSSAGDAAVVVNARASVVVVGLETLTGFDALEDICAVIGGRRIAFSVDLRDRSPVALPNVAPLARTASEVAIRAAAAGAESIIVLDLTRVGTGAGVDAELLADVRRAVPGVTLFAGGGVRGDSDLELLASVGCDGALVATALLGLEGS